VIGWAGFSGSLLWLLWMIVIGGYLIKGKAEHALSSYATAAA
jgi:hypothetical protein